MENKLENMYTIKEVMEILKVSRITITTWIKKGKIKALKVDKIVRIPQSEIEKYIK